MPIKVSKGGRIWLIGADGSYIYEATLVEAMLHLEDTQRQINQDTERRRFEEEEAAKNLRLSLNRLKEEQERTMDLLRLEKKCLESGIAKLVTKERWLVELEQREQRRLAQDRLGSELRKREENMPTQEEVLEMEQRQQRRLAQDRLGSELRKREENMLMQQEALEMERLEFGLLMITMGEEARKTNAEILERDRITQETEAREREGLRTAEAQRDREDSNRNQQAAWNEEMEKLQARKDALEDNQAEVISMAAKITVTEWELSRVKALLFKAEDAFKRYRKEAGVRIETLIAEHEAKDSATRIELKVIIKNITAKVQELQELKIRMEDDINRTRDQQAVEIDLQRKDEDSSPRLVADVEDVESNDFVFIDSDGSSSSQGHASTRDSDSDNEHHLQDVQDGDSDLTDEYVLPDACT